MAKSSLGLPAAEFKQTSFLPCRVATAPCKHHLQYLSATIEVRQLEVQTYQHVMFTTLHTRTPIEYKVCLQK